MSAKSGQLQLLKAASLRMAPLNLRALRYLDVANMIMGERAFVVCPYTDSVRTLQEAMQLAENSIGLWRAGKPLPMWGMAPREVLRALFPMIVFSTGVDGTLSTQCAYVIWNSVSPNRWPWLNAQGEIDEQQMKRGTQLLARYAHVPLVHVAHHQIGLPRTSRWNRLGWTTSGMLMGWAPTFARWLANRGAFAVLLHGHHHRAFTGNIARTPVHVVSAPSAAYVCNGDSLIPGVDDGRAHWLMHSARLVGCNVLPLGQEPRCIGA